MAQIQGSGNGNGPQDVWGLQGNSGQGNWLGTSDNTDLILKANGQERLRLRADGGLRATGLLQAERLKVLGLTELDSVRTVFIRANRFTSQNPGDTLIFFGDSTVVLDHANNHIYVSEDIAPGESNTDKNMRVNCQQIPTSPPAGWKNDVILNQYAGKVGIGTASPSEKLHVSGDVRITGSKLHVNSAGNVGIGTNSPQARLDVRKTGGNYALRLQSDGTVIAGQLSGGGSTARIHFGDGNHYIGSTWGKGVTIGTYNAADVIYIQENSGKVGIGVGTIHTFGGGLLEVNGAIRAKKMVAEVDGWPDYVFDDSYGLMELSELRCFIEDRGHLPKMPTAVDLEKNGLDLGELITLQMQKIEELTLYILHLEEEVQALKATGQ